MKTLIDIFVNILGLLGSIFGLLIIAFALGDAWRRIALWRSYRSISVSQALWDAPLDQKLKINGRIDQTNPSIRSPISQDTCVFWQVALSTALPSKSQGFPPTYISSMEYPKELVMTDDNGGQLTLNLRNADVEFSTPPHFMDYQTQAKVFSFKNPRTLAYLNDISSHGPQGKNITVREYIVQPNQSLVVWGKLTDVDRQRILIVEKMMDSQRSLVPRMIITLLLSWFMASILVEVFLYSLRKLFGG
ncbi:hypothetical protein L3556_11225 [Candidatus Synechococcus calcipolaris G9]|uniref:RING-type E3 ubiquitin transferase n=1 Tax=Candidatus Synechococcus calcipolaris G9 TaxID=1497997 RepID=A0ABT6F0W2_9SYNE|nr:hypothetical protein [Candidatus Synechococcus calcipolaris]MDG2991496.1 hypothetical protein [Candidatus Synechococcus calcipolaris G9]